MRAVATCGVLFAAVFLQQPGRTVADTKLDLVENPLGFLARALHLWEPEGFAGQLQNQAYGYLFPIGPFFALGHVLHIPGWAIQRLWWGVVLCTAFLGARSLAARLGIGTPATQLLAGLAYALAPRMISTVGPLRYAIIVCRTGSPTSAPEEPWPSCALGSTRQIRDLVAAGACACPALAADAVAANASPAASVT